MGKLYLISGNDEFGIKKSALDIITGLCGEDPEDNPALDIIAGDKDAGRPEEILGRLIVTLSTPPFLTPEKSVWLKHFEYFDKVLSAKGEKNYPQIKSLIEFIEDGIPEDMNLIIDGPGIDRRMSFYKLCDKKGQCLCIKKSDLMDKKYTENLLGKIAEFADRAGKRIEPNAMRYLAETIGSDTGRIINELEKLYCYTGERDTVTLADCEAVCSHTPEAMSWSFADSLIERNTVKALNTIDILTQQSMSRSNSELGVLRMTIRRFQELVKTRAAAAQLGLDRPCDSGYFYSIGQDVKERFDSNYLLSLNPFRAFMLCRSAFAFSEKELASSLKMLLETDRRLVSGGVSDSRTALESLAVAITSDSRKGRKNGQRKY